MHPHFLPKNNSGGSRGGAPGARASPLFWVKKEETDWKEEKLTGQVNYSRAPSLAQGLDPPLNNALEILMKEIELSKMNSLNQQQLYTTTCILKWSHQGILASY